MMIMASLVRDRHTKTRVARGLAFQNFNAPLPAERSLRKTGSSRIAQLRPE